MRVWVVIGVMIGVVLLSASAPAQQREEDDYTRYELLAPGSAKFRILYEVSATSPGATHYCNSVRSGSTVSDIAVRDRMTGRELPFEIVRGAGAHPCGIRPSDPEHDYIGSCHKVW